MVIKVMLLVMLAFTASLALIAFILRRIVSRNGTLGVPGFFAVFLVSGGLLAVGLGGREFFLGRESMHWLRTDGVIRSAQLSSESGTDGGTTYGAKVSYEYRVDGFSYVGTRICFGDYQTSEGGHARSILDRYGPGAKVPVFYDPSNPNRAVLETGVHGGVWLPLGVGSAFWIVAAFLFLKGRTTKVIFERYKK
jgi:hypothetical protein